MGALLLLGEEAHFACRSLSSSSSDHHLQPSSPHPGQGKQAGDSWEQQRRERAAQERAEERAGGRSQEGAWQEGAPSCQEAAGTFQALGSSQEERAEE